MSTDAPRNPSTSETLRLLREAWETGGPPGLSGAAWANGHEGQHGPGLLHEARRILCALPQPLAQMRVLDLACGVAAGSRMLIDLGVAPQRVVVADLRRPARAEHGAVAPGVECCSVEDLIERPARDFHLAVQCGVFSRIRREEARMVLARLMSESVGDRGHILWLDSPAVDDGGRAGALDPVTLFPDRALVSLRQVSLPTPDPDGSGPHAVRGPLPHGRSHSIALFGPRLRSGARARANFPSAAAPRADPGKQEAPAGPRQAAPAAGPGVLLGAWEPFQHRPLLDVYARHYGHEVLEVEGVLVTARRLPGLGVATAQVYGPEATAGAAWPERVAALDAGELVVMTNTPAPGWRAHSDERLASMVVDLRGGPGQLWARFEQRARNAVRRAEKAGVEVAPSRAPGDLEDFHAIVTSLSQGGRRFPVSPLQLLRGLLDTGHASLYMARRHGRALGGLVALRHRHAHVLLACFDAEACGRLPSAIVYTQAMFEEQALGCDFFDLGPHVIGQDAGLVQAKRAYRPLLVPAFRYVRRGRGWRARAIALSRLVAVAGRGA